MGILDTLAHSLMDNESLHFSPPESQSHSNPWLLTLSAPLSAFNGDYLNSVATGKDSATLARSIEAMWDVHDRKTFEITADWLISEGHRTAYEQVWRTVGAVDALKQHTPAALRLLLAVTFPGYYRMRCKVDYAELSRTTGKSSGDVVALLENVDEWTDGWRTHFDAGPEQIESLVAWDAVRLASLTRWAVQLGYIGETEFDRFAGALSPQVKEAYSGWKQVSGAYLIGGYIWNSSGSRMENLMRTNRMLLTHPQSPYVQVPW